MRLSVGIVVGLLLLASVGAPVAAAVTVAPGEVSLLPPAYALVGAATPIAGRYHLAFVDEAPLFAREVELMVDGVAVGSDAFVLGSFSVAHTFPARGAYALQAVADAGSVVEARSAVVTLVAAEPASAPGAVLVEPLGGGVSVAVTWDAPADDGGSPIVGYDVQRRDTPSSGWMTLASLPAGARSHHQPMSMATGANDAFRVAARTGVGLGAWSGPIPITGSPPPTPTLSAGVTHLSDRVDITVAATGEPTQQIAVERRLSADHGWSLVGTVNGGSGGLTDNVPPGYLPEYRAIARSLVGDSPPSAPVAVAGVPPGVPTAVSLAVSDHIEIAWSPPTSGGALQGYRVYEDGELVESVPYSRTWSRVWRTTPGDHEYSVVATNAAGWSDAASATLSLAQASAPALTGLTIEQTYDGRVELSWDASADDGGAPILGYAIWRDPSASHWNGTPIGNDVIAWVEADAPLVFAQEDLRHGQEYTYQVTAYTVAGYGEASTYVASVPAVTWDRTHALTHFVACEGATCTNVPANGTYHRAGTGAVSYKSVYAGTLHRNGAPLADADVYVTIWEESDPELENAETNTATTDATGAYVTEWTRPTSITPTACTLIGFYSAPGMGYVGTIERFTICP